MCALRHTRGSHTSTACSTGRGLARHAALRPACAPCLRACRTATAPRCQSRAGQLADAPACLRRAAAAATLSSLCLLGGAALSPGGAWAAADGLTRDTYVYDSGRLLSTDKRARLDTELAEFARTTGWNVRVVTSYGPGTRPDDAEVRAAWGPLDKRSIVIEYDATTPSLINVPYLGDEVLATLRRPWWLEWKGRFGNLFFVRERGEAAAIGDSMPPLLECLARPGGCLRVPGLTEEQYGFTLVTSVAGGLVAGFVGMLEPQGFVQRRWVWLLLFSPLWGSLFINFGLGPVVSRTEDKLPILGNTLGFAAGAAAPYLAQMLRAPPLRDEQ